MIVEPMQGVFVVLKEDNNLAALSPGRLKVGTTSVN
jgi:hypothetical protein